MRFSSRQPPITIAFRPFTAGVFIGTCASLIFINREMKEEPTMLLIIKDRLWEPTMCMKTNKL